MLLAHDVCGVKSGALKKGQAHANEQQRTFTEATSIRWESDI